MRGILIFAAFFLLWAGSAYAGDVVQGSILFSNGDFKYATVTLADTGSDGYIDYYTGRAQGYPELLYFDPYNQMWFAGPIGYKPSSIYFGGGNIKGFVRTFGDGTGDNRFFFGRNGHVYQRVDVYRVHDKGDNPGKNKGRGKKIGHNKPRKEKAYSFWVDLTNRNRGDVILSDWVTVAPGPNEINAVMRYVQPVDYGYWREIPVIRPVTLDPVSDEVKLSLGISFEFNL